MKNFVLSAFLSCASTVVASPGLILAAEAAHAPEVGLDEFKKIVADKSATIIDANGPEMYKNGHVPGAVNFASNESKFASVLPKDKKALIVAYCGGPLCTAWQDPAKAAQQLGYTNVKHFKGGIKGWKEAGQKVEAGT